MELIVRLRPIAPNCHSTGVGLGGFGEFGKCLILAVGGDRQDNRIKLNVSDGFKVRHFKRNIVAQHLDQENGRDVDEAEVGTMDPDLKGGNARQRSPTVRTGRNTLCHAFQ